MTTAIRSPLVRDRATSSPRWALFEKGFRPFFLLGAAFAAFSVPAWLVALQGGVTPGGPFGPMQWHAHEMLFGFTTAIIAGFLLTAICNWTSRETLVGVPLAGLAGLWLLGRVTLFFAGSLPRWVPLVVDGAFLPTLALVCARPLVGSRNRRNYGFLAMLAVMATMNMLSHAGALGGNLERVRFAHRIALDVITLMMALMIGRVLPMFTRNKTGLTWIRSIPTLERASLIGLISLIACDAFALDPRWSVALATATSLLLLARMRYWGSLRTAHEPLLWILHVGAFWLPIGLMLRAASTVLTVPASSALHALTAGAIGSLTLGMMARVSLGHTGRMLKAPRAMPLAFLCVTLAGLVRVLAPFFPAVYLHALELAGLAWTAAFATFLIAYLGPLTAPRVDGR